MLQSMTKNLSSNPGKENNFSRRREGIIFQSSCTPFDLHLSKSSENKVTKKTKRKASSGNSNSTENKKGKVRNSNHHLQPDIPPQNTDQKKLPSKVARLAPLLHRPCPDKLIQIESFKSDNKGSSKESSSVPQFASFDAPTFPQRFGGGGFKISQIFEQRRKNRETFIISSNVLTQSAFPSRSLERNCSISNTIVSRLYNKKKRFVELFEPSSQTASSKFPDVAQLYENQSFCSRLPDHLRSSCSKRNRVIEFNLSLPVHRKPLAPLLLHPRTPNRSSPCSQSVPNTPPTVSISGNISGNSHRGRSLPLGAVLSCNSFQDFERSKVATTVSGVGENTTGTQSEVSSAAAQEEEEDKSSKQSSDNTLKLFTSLRKAMNSNNNQQVSAKQKSSQPLLQYYTGRTRPRIPDKFSSSFILPFGLGGKMPSSPVPTPTIPSSSSFHGGPLESLQLMSDNHRSTIRQQARCSNGHRPRKLFDRQRIKMLKPLAVNKAQNNIAKLYDISTSEFSAAILPDTGTATYRLANDISFDEGSRYNRSTDFPHGLKGKDDLRGQHMNVNGLTQQFGSSISMRGNEVARANSQSRQDGRYREHSSTNNPSFKDTAPVSLIRMEERCELPPAASPSTPTMPSAIAASASTPSFIPPSSASKPKTSATSLSGGSITFRMHKEKQNWNYRAGELSVSGGGYMNPLTGSSNPKQELDAINPINITSAVQRNLHTRERAMATASKSRMSSRYSSKMDSSGTNASYSDPCISAPPSFQQRLTDLSILESETIKYERSRKLRRKKNQDKDS